METPINDERRPHGVVDRHVKLFHQIIGQPEKIKPPDAVGHQFAHEKRPRLAVSEQAGTAGVSEFVRTGEAWLESGNHHGDDSQSHRHEVNFIFKSKNNHRDKSRRHGNEIGQRQPAGFVLVMPAPDVQARLAAIATAAATAKNISEGLFCSTFGPTIFSVMK